MIYPQVNPLEFSLKYNVPLIKEECRGCGKEVEVNVPVISKDFVGFESEPHEPCGQSFVVTYVKPVNMEF
jgi:hypothetical protein